MAARDSKSKNTASQNTKRGAFALLRIAFVCCLLGGSLAGIIYASQRFEHFMVDDPRFAIAPPPEFGHESPDLQLDGIRYASRAQVLRVFSNDIGRSVYLFPLAERRRELLRIAWIKDAEILRIWPDRIVVRVQERQPAAFIALAFGSMSRYALIDSEGVILNPPARARFNLPVLTGIAPGDNQAMRGKRVRRMQQVLRDLNSLAPGISEVDVSDFENVTLRVKKGDRSLLIELGDTNFASRYRTFLDHYAEIQNRMPDVTGLDLRLDDRITAVQGGQSVQ